MHVLTKEEARNYTRPTRAETHNCESRSSFMPVRRVGRNRGQHLLVHVKSARFAGRGQGKLERSVEGVLLPLGPHDEAVLSDD